VGIVTVIIIAGSVLLTLAITGASLFFMWKVFSGFNKTMQESAQLMATGVPAQAKILSVRDLGGSIQIGGQLPQQRLQIDLEIYPAGGQPYRASPQQLVSMMAIPRVQPGAMVQVRYDASNPMRVAVVL
jgi:hypothetical protein